MDEHSSGVLSYSVEAIAADETVEGAVGRGSAAAAVVTIVGIIAGYFLLNLVPSQRLLTWTIGLAVPALSFALVGRRLRRMPGRRLRKSALILGPVTLLGLVIVVNSVGTMRPTFPQLVAALSDSAMPEGYVRVDEIRRGDRLGREGYPRIERFYRAPAGVQDPVAEMVVSMYRHGWRPYDRNLPDAANTAALRGLFRADLIPLGGGMVKVLVMSTG